MKIPITLDQLDEQKWKNIKGKWKQKITEISLPKDLDSVPENIVNIEYELDVLYNEASYFYSKYKTLYEDMNDYIEAIKYVFRDKGNNPEERKSIAYKMLIYYPFGEKNPEAQNLIEIRNRVRDRYYFFKDCIVDNIKEKRNALNTDIGAGKIEANITTSYGAGA
jgi:hypothetical protein